MTQWSSLEDFSFQSATGESVAGSGKKAEHSVMPLEACPDSCLKISVFVFVFCFEAFRMDPHNLLYEIFKTTLLYLSSDPKSSTSARTGFRFIPSSFLLLYFLSLFHPTFRKATPKRRETLL